jgi:Zn-dependent protease
MDSNSAQHPAGSRAPGSLGVIRIFGVPVRFHFTFWLAAVWLIYIGSTGAQSVAGTALYVIGLFLSVLLHEGGHAISARHYGIRTLEIVMLPLGGLARLERQPKSSEEFWVALSGPLVLLAVTYGAGGAISMADWQKVSDQNILPRLAVANLVLALFNLLPAFPMDGGRVMRSLLAARRTIEEATRLTARLGTGIAALMALYGLLSANFLFVFFAFFVYVGALQESMAISTQALMSGALVRDAMITEYRTLNHGDTIREAAGLLLATSQQDFPVVAGSQVVGLLSRAALLRAMAAEGPDAFVAGAMDRDFTRLAPEMDLSEATPAMASGGNCALVFAGERLAGMLTAENLSEFLILRKIRAGQPGSAEAGGPLHG